MKFFLILLSLFFLSSQIVLAANDKPAPADTSGDPTIVPTDIPITQQPTVTAAVNPSPTDVPVPTATPVPANQQPKPRQNPTPTSVPNAPTSTPTPTAVPATPTDKPTPEQNVGLVVKNSYHPSPTPIPNVVNVFSEPDLYASSKLAPLYTTALIIFAVIMFAIGYSLVDKTPHSLPKKIEEKVIFNKNRIFSLPVLRSIL